MKPYVSVVIPCYNNPAAVTQLLRSLAASQNPPPYEIIVVDDGSPNPLTELWDAGTPKIKKGKSEKYIKTILNKLIEYKKYTKISIPVTLVTLARNTGPAIARNRGVAAASGQIIVFMDCDVEVFPDTLRNLARIFKGDPDIAALTGVWVKEQRSADFFPNFKALRDWSYWINERDKSGYYFLFSTRIAAIKKGVFERVGGFDESYPAPLVEDIELTYRIARRYAIIFAPEVRVRHEFEGFIAVAKKYFLRAYYWTRLYGNRKKFDPVATTFTEAITAISGVGVIAMVPVMLLSYFWLPQRLSLGIQIAGVLVLFLHLYLVRQFLVFVYREKGVSFAIRSFLTGLILYCFIFSGALFAKVRPRG